MSKDKRGADTTFKAGPTPEQTQTLTEVAAVLTLGNEAISLAFSGGVRELVHAFPDDATHYGWLYHNGPDAHPPADMLPELVLVS